MSNQRPGMLVPALVGGVVAGVISAIPFFKCLCCLWIIGGAMLAAYLLSKDSPVALTGGDGAIVGIFAGIVAAVVHAFVNIPFQSFNREFLDEVRNWITGYMEEVPSGWENLFEGGFSIGLFFAGLVVSAMIFAAFGALGGIIGISLFGKKAAQKSQGATGASENTGDRQS